MIPFRTRPTQSREAVQQSKSRARYIAWQQRPGSLVRSPELVRESMGRAA